MLTALTVGYSVLDTACVAASGWGSQACHLGVPRRTNLDPMTENWGPRSSPASPTAFSPCLSLPSCHGRCCHILPTTDASGRGLWLSMMDHPCCITSRGTTQAHSIQALAESAFDSACSLTVRLCVKIVQMSFFTL